MKTLTSLTAVLICLLQFGCASDTPRVDAELGHAVDWLAVHQTFDPFAGLVFEQPLPPGDGVRLHNALEANRKDVASGVIQLSRSVAFDAGKP